MANQGQGSFSSIKSAASGAVESAVGGLTDEAETQKNAGADAISGFARSVRATADNLEGQSPQIAKAVRTSADTVERFSQEMKARSVDEMLEATAEFAHRRPMVFLSLGVLAGIVLTRAFSSSR